MARGWAIPTKNSQDFAGEAARHDYDVSGIEDITRHAQKQLLAKDSRQRILPSKTS
jgi:hypothetical protein